MKPATRQIFYLLAWLIAVVIFCIVGFEIWEPAKYVLMSFGLAFYVVGVIIEHWPE